MRLSARRFVPLRAILYSLFLTSALAAAQAGANDGEPAADAGGTARGRAVRLTMRDGLRFDPARFEAAPGEEISLRLRNNDTTDMMHNFLLLRPGTREEVLQAAMALADRGTARDWVPEHPAVLVHSRLVETNKTATVNFRAPDAPGIYPFACTFPGHGMVMYGALYVGVKPPPLEKDPNIPPSAAQSALAGGGKRPFAQRIFMPEAGPAAIAVALAGSQNACWDAGECRLRYVWQGSFIDPMPHWLGNGRGLPKLSATPWWRAPKDAFPFRFGAATAPAVKFLGYAATPAGPEFHYRAGEQEVFEQILPRREGPGITIHYRLPGARTPVTFHPDGDASVQWTSTAGAWRDRTLTLSAAEAADFSVSLTSALCTP